jgi:hypothetical protein
MIREPAEWLGRDRLVEAARRLASQIPPSRASTCTTVLIAPVTALAQTPLGIVENTLGRFDRDTLQPVGPTINLPEPHAAPVFAPDGERFAIGLSKAGVDRTPRIGLWIVDPDQMTVVHEVHTGIAAEAVVYPGVVAALLQSGELLVVDPKNQRLAPGPSEDVLAVQMPTAGSRSSASSACTWAGSAFMPYSALLLRDSGGRGGGEDCECAQQSGVSHVDRVSAPQSGYAYSYE